MAVLQNAPNLSSLREQLTSRVSYSFCGSGIWEQLHWLVEAQDLSWGCNPGVGQSYGLLRTSLGWRIQIQGALLTWQVGASCWHEYLGHVDLSIGLRVLPLSVWVPQSTWTKGKARRKLQCFDVPWESHSTAAKFYGENYLHLLNGEASQNCGCTSDCCSDLFANWTKRKEEAKDH